MFDLWRLKRSRRKVVRAYERDRQKLKKKKNRDPGEFEELEHAEWQALQAEDDAINAFLSDQLWHEAREHDIEIPKGEGVWEDSLYYDRKYLTMGTRANLRRLIDESKARRFEVKTIWMTKLILPILGGLVGIIGALTGLFAVMHRNQPAPQKKTPVYEVPIQVKAAK
jgi:hypothetical protein